MGLETQEVPKLSVTGGPGGGKSIAVEALRSALGGRIVVVPEVASIVLRAFPNPRRKEVEWSQSWQTSLQRAILTAQFEAEAAWQLAAQHQGAKLIVCDRGILDGAAYCAWTASEFCANWDLNLGEVFKRYLGVVHLQTLAEFSPELYTANLPTNPERFEDAERATELDRGLRRVWAEHSTYRFIPAGDRIGQKVDNVIDFVRELI